MTTGAFNDPSGDGNPLGQRLVVLKIRRVVQEIVGTVVHRLLLFRGHLPERGTAPKARRDQTGLPAQNFQQAPSRPAIWFDLLVGEKGPRRLPHILRHMDKVDDDDQWDVPLLRHLLEMSNLWKIAIHQSDPALLSLPIPSTPSSVSALFACITEARNRSSLADFLFMKFLPLKSRFAA